MGTWSEHGSVPTEQYELRWICNVLTTDVLILSVMQISNQMGTVKAHVICKNFRGGAI